MSERSLHELRPTWRRPVGGGARVRAHGGQRVLPGRGQIRGTETPTATGFKGGQHANTVAVPLSVVPCRSYQPVGTTASQLFQNRRQHGAASARKRLATSARLERTYFELRRDDQRAPRGRPSGSQVRRGWGICPPCDHGPRRRVRHTPRRHSSRRHPVPQLILGVRP